MSYISSQIRSIRWYQGSTSVAASFSGNVDITITSVDTAKSILIPLLVSNPTTANGNGTTLATSDNTNLTFLFTHIVSSTAVRFNSVANADSGASHNIKYAFYVVEFR